MERTNFMSIKPQIVAYSGFVRQNAPAIKACVFVPIFNRDYFDISLGICGLIKGTNTNCTTTQWNQLFKSYWKSYSIFVRSPFVILLSYDIGFFRKWGQNLWNAIRGLCMSTRSIHTPNGQPDRITRWDGSPLVAVVDQGHGRSYGRTKLKQQRNNGVQVSFKNRFQCKPYFCI